MPGEQHGQILLKGVDVWNAWRNENPEIRPDLSALFVTIEVIVGYTMPGGLIAIFANKLARLSG